MGLLNVIARESDSPNASLALLSHVPPHVASGRTDTGEKLSAARGGEGTAPPAAAVEKEMEKAGKAWPSADVKKPSPAATVYVLLAESPGSWMVATCGLEPGGSRLCTRPRGKHGQRAVHTTVPEHMHVA